MLVMAARHDAVRLGSILEGEFRSSYEGSNKAAGGVGRERQAPGWHDTGGDPGGDLGVDGLRHILDVGVRERLDAITI
jgi:hypothetical protein